MSYMKAVFARPDGYLNYPKYYQYKRKLETKSKVTSTKKQEK